MIKRFYSSGKIMSYILRHLEQIRDDDKLRARVLKNKNIPDDFLEDYLHVFPIEELIVQGREITLNAICANMSKIDWCNVKQNNISQFNRIWSHISREKALTVSFCNNYWNHLNWDIVSEYNKMEEKVLYKCGHFINWKYAQDYRNQINLSERVVRRYHSFIDLDIAAKSPKISDTFIRELKEDLGYRPLRPLYMNTIENKDNIID